MVKCSSNYVLLNGVKTWSVKNTVDTYISNEMVLRRMYKDQKLLDIIKKGKTVATVDHEVWEETNHLSYPVALDNTTGKRIIYLFCKTNVSLNT